MPRTFKPDPLLWRCASCKATNRRTADQVDGDMIIARCRECGHKNELEPIGDDYRTTLGEPWRRK